MHRLRIFDIVSNKTCQSKRNNLPKDIMRLMMSTTQGKLVIPIILIILIILKI